VYLRFAPATKDEWRNVYTMLEQKTMKLEENDERLKYQPLINPFEGMTFEKEICIAHIHTGVPSQVSGKAD
jgi:hypothetical protein